jgi:hypothetical protein
MARLIRTAAAELPATTPQPRGEGDSRPRKLRSGGILTDETRAPTEAATALTTEPLMVPTNQQLWGIQRPPLPLSKGPVCSSSYGCHITKDMVQPLGFAPIQRDALCESKRMCVGVSGPEHAKRLLSRSDECGIGAARKCADSVKILSPRTTKHTTGPAMKSRCTMWSVSPPIEAHFRPVSSRPSAGTEVNRRLLVPSKTPF